MEEKKKWQIPLISICCVAEPDIIKTSTPIGYDSEDFYGEYEDWY